MYVFPSSGCLYTCSINSLKCYDVVVVVVVGCVGVMAEGGERVLVNMFHQFTQML